MRTLAPFSSTDPLEVYEEALSIDIIDESIRDLIRSGAIDHSQ